MKKIVSFACVLCFAMGISAQTVTGTAVLKIYSENSGDKDLTIIQAAEFSDAVDPSYDAEAQAAGGLYVLSNSVHYSIWATNALAENLPLGFGTCNDLNYVLKFDNANFSGTTFTIYDKVADQLITVNGSNSDYNFTIEAAQKNSAIDDRFVINYVAPAPLVQGICFKYNKLELTKYDGATVEVFADGVATAALTQVVAGDAQFDIDLSALASGKYKVVVTIPGVATPEEYIIDVKPAVTVVP